MNRCPDPSALDGRLAGARMPGDEKDYAIPPLDCLFQPAVDCSPSAVEIMAVQVDHAIRLDIAGFQAPVPAPVDAVQRNHPAVLRVKALFQPKCAERRHPLTMIATIQGVDQPRVAEFVVLPQQRDKPPLERAVSARDGPQPGVEPDRRLRLKEPAIRVLGRGQQQAEVQ